MLVASNLSDNSSMRLTPAPRTPMPANEALISASSMILQWRWMVRKRARMYECYVLNGRFCVPDDDDGVGVARGSGTGLVGIELSVSPHSM